MYLSSLGMHCYTNSMVMNSMSSLVISMYYYTINSMWRIIIRMNYYSTMVIDSVSPLVIGTHYW